MAQVDVIRAPRRPGFPACRHGNTSYVPFPELDWIIQRAHQELVPTTVRRRPEVSLSFHASKTDHSFRCDP